MCFDSLENVCRTEGYAIVCCVANTGGTYMLLLTQERKNKNITPRSYSFVKTSVGVCQKNPQRVGI